MSCKGGGQVWCKRSKSRNTWKSSVPTVSTVDHLEGSDKIKLTKTDPQAGGKHHLIPLAWVSTVDQKVHLNRSSKDAQTQWQAAAA
jgi:hypothetical protein